METDFTNSWATQKLADFLAAINTAESEAQVFATAAEIAADALDAELGVVTNGTTLTTAFGEAISDGLHSRLTAALDGQAPFTLPGVGKCVVTGSKLDSVHGYLILARRADEPFSSGELVLLRSMARALSMAVTSLRLLTRTREQEESLASVIRTSLDCIVLMDADARVLEWNPAAETTFGYTRSEAIGQDMTSLVIPERFRDAHRRGLARFLETGADQMIDNRVEIAALRRDGTEFTAELAVTVVAADPPRFTAYLRDISERKAATARLQETTRRLSALVDSLNAGLVLETEERTIGLVNTRFCELFDLDAVPDDLAGASCTVASQQLGSRLVDPVAFARRSDEIFEAGLPVFDDVVVLEDGRTFERDHIPISADGHNHGRLWVYRDVTARITFERDLAEARDNALAASRLKSSFLATMSHEIRTPMNGVVGLVDLLAETELTAKQDDLVRMLDRSAEHLMGVIDDILDFSRIEAGELKLEAIPCIPAVAIDDVVQLFAHRAETQGIELRTAIAPELSGTFISDPGRLRQILQNLVGNALKFTRQGSVTIEASVHAADESMGEFLQVAVTDTGIGISPEASARLFEPFIQADASTSRLYGGSGLGLSICHRLAELLGGTIWVVSEQGVGSTFTLALPLTPAREHAQDGSVPPYASPTAGAAEHTAMTGRILVVEDNPVNQAVVELQLSRLGHQAFVVNGGLAALDALQAELGFDVVLMDCQMPGMDGFTATQRIRQLESTASHIPVIAMTANAQREDRVACLAAGMDDYLSKPVRVENLQAVLARWIATGRMRREHNPRHDLDDLPAVDRQVLDDLVADLGGDPSVLAEFTEIFLRELPRRLEAIQAQLPLDDRREMRERVHALRSPSRALGLTRLDAICDRMEQAAISGRLGDVRSMERNLLEAAAASVEELCQLTASVANTG